MSFLSCEEMLAAARSQNISLSEAILRSDLAESRLTEAHSREMMHHLRQVMQATSRDYDPAQRSRSGLSGGDAAKVEQAHQEGKSLGGDYLANGTGLDVGNVHGRAHGGSRRGPRRARTQVLDTHLDVLGRCRPAGGTRLLLHHAKHHLSTHRVK